jgi:hypothetical protein
MTNSERAWQIAVAKFPDDEARRRKLYHALKAKLAKQTG